MPPIPPHTRTKKTTIENIKALPGFLPSQAVQKDTHQVPKAVPVAASPVSQISTQVSLGCFLFVQGRGETEVGLKVAKKKLGGGTFTLRLIMIFWLGK